ncbi:MAG: ABC transporter substrate-binding protein [Deltaproteobacteria bacterium]|nr:ABC transporter substrate-binding protein [Deltaproteobacteria bacterium]
MKRGFALAACVAVALVGTAACRKSGEERLRRGDRLVTATISDPKTFNPLLSVDAASTEAVGDVFEGLVRLNPKTKLPEPVLATLWEHDEAGTTWTFHLREGVTWHDGAPFTADDVAFSFDAVFDPRVPNSAKHVLMVGGQPMRTEVVDPHTIKVMMAEPFAPLLNSVGFDILPKHLLGQALKDGTFTQTWGIDTPPEKIVGTGSYRLVRYVPAQLLQYARNPTYWMRDEAGGALPRLAERTTLIVPDQNTMYLKFLDRQLHMYSPRPEEIDDLRARTEELEIALDKIGLDTGMLFVSFNRNPAHYVKDGKADPRLAWFTDSKFVRAVAHSLDKRSMIQNTYFGYGEPAVSAISPENTAFYNPNLTPYEYDLDTARRLLDEGGYRDRDGDGVREDAQGHPLEFELSTNAGNQVRERLCSILKEDWTKLGIKVNYRPLDFATLVEKLSTNFDWDAMVMGFTGGVEPHASSNLLRSSGNLHMWQPNQRTPATPWEAEIDRELAAGARELDPQKRVTHYWKIQEILHRELPMIQLVRQQRFIAAKSYLVDFVPTVWGVYQPERIAIRP